MLGGKISLQLGICGVGATLLLLGDQGTESCLCLSALLGVLGRQLLGLALLLGDRHRQCYDLGALVLEVLAFLVEVFDQRIEIVGRDRADRERDAAVLIAAETIAVRRRIREQRTEHIGAGARERTDSDCRQVTPQGRQLGLFGADAGLRLDHFLIQLVLVIDGLGVVLGERVCLGLEAVEFIDDPGNLTALIVDARDGDVGVDRWHHEHHRESNREDSMETLHRTTGSVANVTNVLRSETGRTDDFW